MTVRAALSMREKLRAISSLWGFYIDSADARVKVKMLLFGEVPVYSSLCLSNEKLLVTVLEQ